MTATKDESQARRLAKLESQQAALEAGQAQLVREVQKLGRILDTLSERLTHQQRTPWGTLGTWAGVIIGLSGLIGGLVASSINSRIDNLSRGTNRDFVRLENMLRAHEKQRAHPGALEDIGRQHEKLAALEARVRSQDDVLQREMRLLDNRLEGRLDSLDRRILQEVRLHHTPLQVQVADLERRMVAAEKRSRANTAVNAMEASKR